MFDRQPSPKRSFDFGLTYAFSVALLLQSLLLTDKRQRILVAAIELAIVVGLSFWYRRRNQWQWPRAQISRGSIGTGIFRLLLCALFVFLWLNQVGVSADFQGHISVRHPNAHIPPSSVSAFLNDPSSNGVISVLIICLLFSLLESLKVVDVNEAAFFQNCQVPENRQPIGGPLRKFIHDRPLTIEKTPDAIRLEFPLSPPQEVGEAWAIVLVFVIFFAFGFSHVGYVLVMDLGPRTLTGFEMTGEWAIQIYSFIFGSVLVTFAPWVIWQWGFRNLLVRRVMEFKPDRLIISDRLWGRDRPKIEIPKMDLQPLRESNGQTTFPGNKLFWLQYRGKDMMLARFLLSTGMEAIQTTYDRYRTTNFAEFYRDTESLNLPLD
jgi:hypothetical protein